MAWRRADLSRSKCDSKRTEHSDGWEGAQHVSVRRRPLCFFAEPVSVGPAGVSQLYSSGNTTSAVLVPKSLSGTARKSTAVSLLLAPRAKAGPSSSRPLPR